MSLPAIFSPRPEDMDQLPQPTYPKDSSQNRLAPESTQDTQNDVSEPPLVDESTLYSAQIAEEDQDLHEVEREKVLLPLPYKKGIVAQRGTTWPYFLEDVNLILDSFHLFVYRRGSSVTQPKQVLSLMGEAVTTSSDCIVTVKDDKGRTMDINCKTEGEAHEWHHSIYHAIEAGRGYEKMSAENTFMWLAGHQNHMDGDRDASDNDLVHMASLNQISMELMSNRLTEMEENQINRRKFMNRMGTLAIAGGVGVALFQSRKFWRPHLESSQTETFANLGETFPDLESSLKRSLSSAADCVNGLKESFASERFQHVLG